MSILDVVRTYKATYSNYISVMLNMYRRKDVINVVLKDNTKEQYSYENAYILPRVLSYNIPLEQCKKLTWNELAVLDQVLQHGGNFDEAMKIAASIEDMRHSERISYRDKLIIMHGLHENGDIVGVFIMEDYKFLNVENQEVIDIGANIGDTAIYFALKGSNRVIALEPYPYSFELALRNVAENGLKEKIRLINAGYGKDKEIFIDENIKSSLGLQMSSYSDGKKILKMDCEGCEYDLLKEDNSVLRKFSQVQIEFHHGYKILARKLRKAGFAVDIDYKLRGKSLRPLGFIYANRKNGTLGTTG